MQNLKRQRKVILDLAVTLDGFIEGKNGETDWCIMDDEMEFNDFLNQIDTILYGRKSYDLWGHYQPQNQEESELWDLIHDKKKYVFSTTRNGIDRGAIFINDNISEVISDLKAQPGKDIWLYGGAGLISTFIDQGLVDEFRLSIHPLALGEGKPLFEDLKERLPLQLMDTNVFSSGVVQLIYRPK